MFPENLLRLTVMVYFQENKCLKNVNFLNVFSQ